LIKITRSRDYKAIRDLVTDPAVFPFVADDFVPRPELWEPPESDLIHYLLASDDQSCFGFAVFMPRTHTCYEAHIGFLPRSYGAIAIAAFKEMLDWMWANTTAVRIVGEIAQENRKAIKFAVGAGFEPYGVNSKSILRDGVLHDQLCLGISRP